MNVTKSLADFIAQIASMKRHVENGRAKPHKLIMLLTVVELFEQGELVDNRIPFDKVLLDQFGVNFVRYAQTSDYHQPPVPFFHLRSSAFWNHRVSEGRAEAYGKIKKAGASYAWITDNIDYAYLNDSAYSVVRSPNHRAILKEFVKALLLEDTKNMRKIGLAFHETLKLRRTNIVQVLKCFAEGMMDQDTIYKQTSLGTNEVKSAPGYLRGSGLIDWDKQLTLFGKKVLVYDPSLIHTETLWLMHYHLTAPNWFAPSFWEMLFRKVVGVGKKVTTETLSEAIIEHLQETEERQVNINTIRATVNIFFRTYVDQDGLGNLNILREEEPSVYTVGMPVEIPWRVFAYMLADYWEANFGLALTVPLGDLGGDAGLGALLLLNSGQIGQLLKPMQEAGLVEINRVSRPWTVVRRWADKNALLEAVYTEGNDGGA